MVGETVVFKKCVNVGRLGFVYLPREEEDMGVTRNHEGNTSITSKVSKVPVEAHRSALPEVKRPLHESEMAISAHFWQGKPVRKYGGS